MSNMPEENLVVLVNSCDKYADIWPVFFQLFFKYWPDCPYPVFLGSNEKVYDDPRVTTLCAGPDKSWADTTRAMVAKVPATNILWFLDDFFLYGKVSNSEIADYYDRFVKLQGNYLRMQRDGGSKLLKRDVDNKLLEIFPGDDYRASLGIAFWRRSTLLDLLKAGESPWEMESCGSRRSDQLNGFYAVREDAFQRKNGLERGKWLREHLPFYASEGITIPPGHAVMSRTEHNAKIIKQHLKRYLKRSLVPFRSVYRVLKDKKINE
jgi:hypothetical protein